MTKNSKRKLLLMTLLLTLMLVSSAYSIQVPNAYAAEMTIQQKGLAISKDVVGLDTTRYAVNTKEYPQDSYRGVLPQENIRYELNSAGSNVEVLYTFVNGKLLMLKVLENQGSPRLTKTVNDVAESAKDFLNSYQSYSRNSFYGELSSTLVGVDSSRNSTKTVGNTKLEVSNYRERVTFKWTYTFNGIEAPDKVVALGYENGFLERFYDSWDLYKIGSTDVNVSEEEAINLGMARAKNYSWPVGSNDTYKVKNFNVTGAMIWETVFRSSLVADTARNEDLLMLYPMRHVWVSLDKFYPPGNVYGFNVYVWADTGEVCHIQERFSTVDPPPEMVAAVSDVIDVQVAASGSAFEATSSSLNTLIAIVSCGALVMGIALVWLRRKKNLFMRRFFKLGGLLLCLLTLSMLSVPIATVNADSSQERAMIWGSESSGAYKFPPGWSWRKHPAEVYAQNEVADFLEQKFELYDYSASDYQGDSGSDKATILLKTSEANAYYPRVAVVDFDHGNGNEHPPGIYPPLQTDEFHYMVEDQIGTISGWYPEEEQIPTPENGVFDFEIYPRTADGKVFFAFINTCNSAHIDEDYYGFWDSEQGIVPGTDRARGMPFAWSHRLVIDKDTQGFNTAQHMSDNGYADADGGDFVYIGFDGGSASLAQTVPGSTAYHAEWVAEFFDKALSEDLSVNDALDVACNIHYDGDDFYQTDLCNGYYAIWPMYYGQWYNTTGYGEMKVYGNGNIHLKRKGGAWHFDETSGTTAHDSAHGHDGTLYNGASWWYPKIGERSVHFDGNNDYVGVPSVSGLSGNTPHSIEAWVRVASLPANRAWILQLGNAGTGSHHWLINSAGGTQFGVWNGGQTQPSLPVGKWTHIAMTFNGTTLKCYVNGKLSDSEAATFNLQGTPLTLAKAYNGENYFNGEIDELRIYDYVLSASQIADDAAVASYHLNGGDYAYDNSPNGNTGTIHGASTVTGLHTSSTYSKGLSFDGNNDYVNVPDHYSLDLSSAVTVEAWIKPSRLDVWQSPLEKGADNDWAYGFYIEPAGGNIGFEIGVEGQPVTWKGAVAPVNSYLKVGKWTHIVGTADTATHKVRLYIDGVKVPNEMSFSGQINTNSIPFQIGKRSDGGYFGGIIDEVKIYNRALSASEIYSNYAAHMDTLHWLTVIGTYVEGWGPDISIDSQYTGYIYAHYTMSIDEHTVEVSDWFVHPAYGYFVFDYFSYDGTTDDDNPMTLTVSKDTEVQAVYYYYGW